ncbi:MAG: hypothetical protein AVDCRST_MAG49-78 [uncultured Thermomicrobiales bacterium]|uniref:Uncharacterized protein n=1 Tax=uncultured Thermomicrobiales bacterium TaxID=1645740 RepID=A0A6J4TYD0_9BACT|nr:MAG: hypothetical protein AVDCRST_MAG49-78 [uncultured Thermomicrobiales bacterium]
MGAAPKLDEAKRDAFADRLVRDIAGTYATAMVTVGDRLGLFKDLAARGPATSDELAARTGLAERYLREWLHGLAAAGYLERDPKGDRYALPPEHAPALADEGGSRFLGGLYQKLPAEIAVLDRVIEAFRAGGGVPQAAYLAEEWDGLDRLSTVWFEHQLLQEWLPRMPDVRARLERGARVADLGCGRGRALVKLAQAFPRGTYVGYDVFPPTVAAATANAEMAGVVDRARFEVLDAARGLPESFDVITTFDVVHDAADPLALLRAIRAALRPGGIYVCLDVNAGESPDDNAGPIGTWLYGASLLYCMTTSLAAGGAGLGTLGLPESRLRALCAEAGFGEVRRVPMDNLFNSLYEICP